MPNSFKITKDSAEPVDIPMTLEAMQEIVGGYIEAAFTIPSPFGKGRAVTGYVNEEGMLLGLDTFMTFNGRPFCGPCIVIGLDYNSGESIPLSVQEIEWIKSGCKEMAVVTIPDLEVSKMFNLTLAK